VKLWRWNLHAAVTTMAITPLMIGWAWGMPLMSQLELPFRSAGMVSRPPVVVEERIALAAPAPVESVPSLMSRVQTYQVERGDTMQQLAHRFGISVETLLWANPEVNVNRLQPGQELTVLPVSGVLHTVMNGDTVASIAERYGVTSVRVIEANGLVEPFDLAEEQRVLIPGGKPQPAAQTARVVEWPAPGTGDRNKRQFIEAAAPAAQDTQRRLGIPASVTIAQAIHESYWGSSNLARNANNFFGIKARNGEGSAGTYWMDAWEVINGQDVIVPEPFRKYNSPDESFIDHGQFFLRNSRYHGAFRYSNDPRAFAHAVADAGYATDPAYAPKLIGIMDQFNLYQYDLR
jgi:LysM repeat protein